MCGLNRSKQLGIAMTYLWHLRQMQKIRYWDYLPYGPFETAADITDWIHAKCAEPDPYFFAIIDQATHRAVGVARYLSINPDSGSIEVGHINFAPNCNQPSALLKPCI